MTDSTNGTLRGLTHAELTRQVESLRRVGGVYTLLAAHVERINRPHCVGNVPQPSTSTTDGEHERIDRDPTRIIT